MPKTTNITNKTMNTHSSPVLTLPVAAPLTADLPDNETFNGISLTVLPFSKSLNTKLWSPDTPSLTFNVNSIWLTSPESKLTTLGSITAVAHPLTPTTSDNNNILSSFKLAKSKAKVILSPALPDLTLSVLTKTLESTNSLEFSQ